MSSLRDNYSLGVFANNADEVQNPGEREEGVSYRNTSFTTFQQNSGKAFTQLPASENFNEQIFNLSSFSNLFNRQSILGWIHSVEYNRPASVVGSDGKIYYTKRDGNINVDPVEEDNDNRQWWEPYKRADDLSNIYADETPGDEGAKLVGCTYQAVKGGDRKGVDLQTNLDYLNPLIDKMENMRILAYVGNTSGYYSYAFPSVNLINQSYSFNISSINFFPYSKITYDTPSPIVGIGYLRINFINPLPNDYLCFLEGDPFSQTININKKNVLHQSSTQIGNRTTTSVDIGMISRTNLNNPQAPYWTSPWGEEDPSTRKQWQFNLFCIQID